MRRYFVLKYPHLADRVTEQRLKAEQGPKRITAQRLKRIKREVAATRRALTSSVVEEAPVSQPNIRKREICSESVSHNVNALLIRQEEERLINTPHVVSVVITVENVTKSVNNTLIWKVPGSNGIHNYWLKRCLPFHKSFAKCSYEVGLVRHQKASIFVLVKISTLWQKTIPTKIWDCSNHFGLTTKIS